MDCRKRPRTVEVMAGLHGRCARGPLKFEVRSSFARASEDRGSKCEGLVRTSASDFTALFSQPKPKGKPMKPVTRYQSQLLFRRSYKPDRLPRRAAATLR